MECAEYSHGHGLHVDAVQSIREDLEADSQGMKDQVLVSYRHWRMVCEALVGADLHTHKGRRDETIPKPSLMPHRRRDLH